MISPHARQALACLFASSIYFGLFGCSPATTAGEENAKKPSFYAPRADIQAAKGGITDADIEAVMLKYDYSSSMDTNGIIYSNSNTYVQVLFVNGIGCRDWPDNLIGTSLEAVTSNKDRCFKWRPNKKERYDIQYPGHDWETPDWSLYRRATQDDRLNRSVSDFRSYQGHSQTNYLNFDLSGHYERSSTSRQIFTSATNPTGVAYARSGSHTSKNGTGSYSSVSTFGGAGGGGSLSSQKNGQYRSDLEGDYYVDGYTIELIKGDGTRERKIFGLDWNRSNLIMGGRDYTYNVPRYLSKLENKMNSVIVMPDESFYLTPRHKGYKEVKLYPLGVDETAVAEFKQHFEQVVEADLTKSNRSPDGLVRLPFDKLPNVSAFLIPPSDKDNSQPFSVYLGFLSKQNRSYLFKMDSLDQSLMFQYLKDVMEFGVDLTRS